MEKIKIYYSRISEILRTYIEKRYLFIALELPTCDILKIIEKKNVSKNDVDNLRLILERADLAKFAKSKPTKDQHVESIELSILFITNTKLISKNG